jgi:ATP-dependent Lon protease
MENRKDVEEINEIYRKGLKFRFVSNISELMEFALVKETFGKTKAIA